MGCNYPVGLPQKPPATHCLVDNTQLHHNLRYSSCVRTLNITRPAINCWLYKQQNIWHLPRRDANRDSILCWKFARSTSPRTKNYNSRSCL